jgi:hypothetical protein
VFTNASWESNSRDLSVFKSGDIFETGDSITLVLKGASRELRLLKSIPQKNLCLFKAL